MWGIVGGPPNMKSINICWFSAYSPSMIQTCPSGTWVHRIWHPSNHRENEVNKNINRQCVGGVPYIWIRPLYRFIKPLLIFGSLISAHHDSPFLPKHRENPTFVAIFSMFGISARCRMLFSRQDILNVIICYICWIMYIVHGYIYIYMYICKSYIMNIIYIYIHRYVMNILKKTTNTLLQCVKQKHIHFACNWKSPRFLFGKSGRAMRLWLSWDVTCAHLVSSGHVIAGRCGTTLNKKLIIRITLW